ncbi:MAG TPA: hypothetical protein VI140_04140, partial [Oxalicibacterium sp.]
ICFAASSSGSRTMNLVSDMGINTEGSGNESKTGNRRMRYAAHFGGGLACRQRARKISGGEN